MLTVNKMGFPEAALPIKNLTPDSKIRYSICTLVTKPAEYSRMIQGFQAGGFDDEDCEFLYVDNSVGNQMDAFAAYNLFLRLARGRYLILCHQDIELLTDGRERLDAVIAELIAQRVRDVVFPAHEIVVHTEDVGAFMQQAFKEVGTKEAGAAGDQHVFVS